MPKLWQSLAIAVAKSCQHGGKSLPRLWQKFANTVAKHWQSNGEDYPMVTSKLTTPIRSYKPALSPISP
ncbi:hypothetical protein DXB65_19405 [Bacteroides oleiciplenus]|uniref:Uncharacterized protein n=1 Tax=Bacteroides oleiciplenus TaxID=626931 RepID=A0A3E5B348_9BACE|nr:hypothetical protein DXB65_19405 [Bacteroides oleiciplenus]